ncbi:MAG TPA: hypothetical protein VIF37_11340 [Methylobacter sp.]
MTTPSITDNLVPVIDVLAQCLAQTSENYQQLLRQPEDYALCTEAGRSLRRLSKQYTQVVLAVLAHLSVTDDDNENWANDNESPFEEDFVD